MFEFQIIDVDAEICHRHFYFEIVCFVFEGNDIECYVKQKAEIINIMGGYS